MLRRFATLFWWLGLAAYFGGILTLALAAPAVFKTTAKSGIIMTTIASPPLDASAQAGGEIFGAILDNFAYVEVIALGCMLVGLAGFLFVHAPIRRSTWILLILWALLVACLGYDAIVLRPQVVQKRTEVRTTAAQHIVATTWPAKDEFNVLHKRSESLAHLKAYLLLATLLISAWTLSFPSSKQSPA